MASLRFCACLILMFYAVSRSESRFLNPYIEGRNPTRLFRPLSVTASSGKVYQFSIPLIDEYTKNLYESKRLSPGGPDSLISKLSEAVEIAIELARYILRDHGAK